jgi:hypothetical protein
MHSATSSVTTQGCGARAGRTADVLLLGRALLRARRLLDMNGELRLGLVLVNRPRRVVERVVVAEVFAEPPAAGLAHSAARVPIVAYSEFGP